MWEKTEKAFFPKYYGSIFDKQSQNAITDLFF